MRVVIRIRRLNETEALSPVPIELPRALGGANSVARHSVNARGADLSSKVAGAHVLTPPYWWI